MLEGAGPIVFADAVAPATTATTVDGQGERPVLTDGPFLGAKGQLGGFSVVQAPDLDASLASAAQGSEACRGTVEVRPFPSQESVRAFPES